MPKRNIKMGFRLRYAATYPMRLCPMRAVPSLMMLKFPLFWRWFCQWWNHFQSWITTHVDAGIFLVFPLEHGHNLDRRRDLASRRHQTIGAGPPWHGAFLFCVCNAILYIFLGYSSELDKPVGTITYYKYPRREMGSGQYRWQWKVLLIVFEKG